MATIEDAKADARRILTNGNVDDPKRFKRLLGFLQFHSRHDAEAAELLESLQYTFLEPRPPTQPEHASIQPAVEVKVKRNKAGVSWFERHLNWTWLFGLIGFYVLQYVIGYSYGTFNASSVSNMTQNDLNDFSYGVWLLSIVMVYVPITIWVLLKKGRSWGWIFLSGFFLLPLWIGNKKNIKLPRLFLVVTTKNNHNC